MGMNDGVMWRPHAIKDTSLGKFLEHVSKHGHKVPKGEFLFAALQRIVAERRLITITTRLSR